MELSLSVLTVLILVPLMYLSGYQSSQIVNPVYYEGIYQQESPRGWRLRMNEKQKQIDFLLPWKLEFTGESILGLRTLLQLSPKVLLLRRFYYFNKGYLHTIIRCLQGLYAIVHLYKIVTFTTFIRVLADGKDTTWNRHGYTSKVTQIHEGNRQETGSQARKS